MMTCEESSVNAYSKALILKFVNARNENAVPFHLRSKASRRPKTPNQSVFPQFVRKDDGM